MLVKTVQNLLLQNATGDVITKTRNEHSCGKEPDSRTSEVRQLRMHVRKKSGDITKRPAAIIRNELMDMSENNLHRNDLRNVSLSLYRERRKNFPTLPKSREETHTTVREMDTTTSKAEDLLMVNDPDSGIIIFSTATNMKCLCNDIGELFIDGTFKCCARYFYQLYTIHGGKNGNYVPLLYALLPANVWPNLFEMSCSDAKVSWVEEVFENVRSNLFEISSSDVKVSCPSFKWWTFVLLCLPYVFVPDSKPYSSV